MNILILGAGQVGSSLAHSLASADNSLTVVDVQSGPLARLQESLDLRTLTGHAASPGVLERAGAEDADMVLAVTSSDETNLLACQIAYTLFKTPTRIARVRSAEYLTHPELFGHDAIPIDSLISPEREITDYLRGLIEQPLALQALSLAAGSTVLIALDADAGGRIAGRTPLELATQWQAPISVPLLWRQGKTMLCHADTRIEVDDEVFVVGARDTMRAVSRQLRHQADASKRVIIAGGGHIGLGLASLLEHDFRVKVIESNADRAVKLAETLKKAVVLHGEAADQALLAAEDVDATDVFCALTNNDEANVLAAMLAKHLGARRTIALINKPSYMDMVEGRMVDLVVSPQQVTLGAILPRVRRGDVQEAHTLRRGAAEVLVVATHGDADTSRVIGKRIADLHPPSCAAIAGVVRRGGFMPAAAELAIESGDLMIVVLTDRDRAAELERLFQVDARAL